MNSKSPWPMVFGFCCGVPVLCGIVMVVGAAFVGSSYSATTPPSAPAMRAPSTAGDVREDARHQSDRKTTDEKTRRAFERVDQWEAKRERRINGRLPERRRRQIYLAISKMFHDADVSGSPHAAKAAMDAGFAGVRHRYGLSEDDLDIIRTEGDEADWPQSTPDGF